MFFPDRVAAYREARRVLKPGGHFLFNVWDRLEENPKRASPRGRGRIALFPDDPPSFLERTPFGYHDMAAVEADLRAAGFTDIQSEKVAKRSRHSNAREIATGLCLGIAAARRDRSARPGRLDDDKTPRTERGRKTLRRLLEAAAQEFGERGYHEAAITGITQRAGVALGTFYTYFESKEECSGPSSAT
jgi:SAM-dependent methyltransferase